MSEVRSVTVHLHASVDGYIRDMRRAGRETDRAFAASHANLAATNRELGIASKRLGDVDTAGKSMNTTLARSNTRTRVMAEQTGRLNKELDGLRTRSAALSGGGSGSVVVMGRNVERTGKQLDTMSGRVGLLAEAIAVLGPAAVPISSVTIPALAGLTSQLGFGVAAAGATVIAFQGVGDAIKAIEKARIAPTVQNLQAAHLAMEKLGPAGQHLVRHLSSLRDEWQRVRALTQQGLFPGIDHGLNALETRIPQVERILGVLSQTTGDIVAAGADSLASARWDGFFHFLKTDARPTLLALADATGNVAHGAAEMWMGFAPLEHDFSGWMVGATESFDQWATRLSKTQGFADFVAYVRDNGPQVADTLGAIANAGLQIIEATAPLGGPVLQGLEAVANVISAIADSDFGTPIFGGLAALALFSRAQKLWGLEALASTKTFAAGLATDALGVKSLIGDLQILGRESKLVTLPGKGFVGPLTQAQTSLTRVRSSIGALGKGAALLGGLALATSGVADGMGLSNTMSLALMGTIAGPWGAAIGGGVGLALDLAHANDVLEAAVRRANLAMESGSIDQRRKAYQNLHTEVRQAHGEVQDFGDLFRTSDHDGENYWANLGGAVKGFGIVLTGGTKKADNALDHLHAHLRESTGVATIFGNAVGMTGRQLELATHGAEHLSAALSELQGWLDKRAAVRNYQQSILDLQKALEKTPKAWGHGTALGLENLGKLDSVVTGIAQVATQIKDKGVRADFLANAREELQGLKTDSPAAAAAIRHAIRELDKVGLTHPKVDVDAKPAHRHLDEVEKHADKVAHGKHTAHVDADTKKADRNINATDQLLGVLTHARRIPISADTRAAITGINHVAASLAQLHDKDIHVRILTNTGMGPQVSSARGNLFPPVRAYAMGDIANRHEPQLAGPGPTRVWREPETRGEAYIPLANDDRRPRAKSIAEQTVAMFGGQVSWYGRGGWSQSTGGRGGQTGGRLSGHAVVELVTPWGTQQVDVLMREVAREEIDDDRGFLRTIEGK